MFNKIDSRSVEAEVDYDTLLLPLHYQIWGSQFI